MNTSTQKIPIDWQRVKLGDVCLIKKGKQLNKLDMEIGAEYPALNGGIGPSGYTQNWNTEADTITISEGGNSCGYVNFVESRFWCGGHCYALLNIVDRLDKKFLYQALKYQQNKLMKLRVGSGLPNIQMKSIQEFLLRTPPIKEQKRISEILETVDQEIGKTEQILIAAEKLKSGLMEILFTRGIGHTKYKKTELGELPAEWAVVRLEEVARVERGKFSHRPRNAPEFYGGDIPFIQTGDVVNSRGRIQKYSQSLNGKGLSVSRLFPKGTIVLTIAANIGDTGILEFDSAFPDSLVGITAGSEMNNVFLEYYLRTRKKYLNSIATQSAQKNINLQKLNPMLVIRPPLSEQQKITSMLLSLDEKVSINQKLKDKLTYLKRGLMQDLLSGNKRVKV